MWTEESRARLKGIETKTKGYPSALTDGEWLRVDPFLPKVAGVGSPWRMDLRDVLNAIRYLVRSGREWRMLPVHFPPWQTVYWWFRRLPFVRRLMFRTIHDVALMIDRAQSGRDPQPTAAVIDSQSVKAPAPGAARGFDGAKKIVGRKRHVAVDADGRLLLVDLISANVADSAGAQAVLDTIDERWRWAERARGSVERSSMEWRSEGVERAFWWMMRHRRLVRDYEAKIDVSEAMIDVVMGGLLIRRVSYP